MYISRYNIIEINFPLSSSRVQTLSQRVTEDARSRAASDNPRERKLPVLFPRKINGADHGHSGISYRKHLGARAVIIIPRLAERQSGPRENKAACVTIRVPPLPSAFSRRARTRAHIFANKSVREARLTYGREMQHGHLVLPLRRDMHLHPGEPRASRRVNALVINTSNDDSFTATSFPRILSFGRTFRRTFLSIYAQLKRGIRR